MRVYLPTVIAPLIIIGVVIPLIAGKVGRNYFYGFRTPRTLASDAIWYPANRSGGILLAFAAMVWLGTGLMAPAAAIPVGLSALGIAMLAWVVSLSRLPK